MVESPGMLDTTVALAPTDVVRIEGLGTVLENEDTLFREMLELETVLEERVVLESEARLEL